MSYKKETLIQLLKCVDLTSLDNLDHENSIQKLIDKANKGHEGVYPAAVCVYSNFGQQIKQNLISEIKSAVVAGAFPTGQTLTSAKVEEVKSAALSDIDEIDIVINRGEFLNKNYDYVLRELVDMRKACPNQLLKVILETGELTNQEQIQKASELAIEAGADFIKTSTGKTSIGASTEAVKTMSLVIKTYFEKTGKKIGIKPSGGIKTIEDALAYFSIVGEICGPAWQSPNLFRIGASSLYDVLIEKMNDAN